MTTQRLLSSLTGANFALLAIGLAHGHTARVDHPTGVLRGRALEIVDERGKVRAEISIRPSSTMPDGKTYPEAVVLKMSDPDGLIRVKLGADHDGAGLMLADDSQQPGVHMLAKRTGTFLKLINRDGQERLVQP